MDRGETPIMVYENEEYIKIEVFVFPITLFFVYPKLDEQQTLIFKEQYLNNGRIINYIAEKKIPKININIENGDYSQTRPRPEEL